MPNHTETTYTHTMANTFGILAAVALLFGAFVSYKNGGKLTEINDAIVDKTAVNKRQAKKIDGLNADRNKNDDEAAGFNATKEELIVSLEEQNSKNQDLENKIVSKRNEANAAEAKADEAENILKEVGNIRDLIPRMKALTSDIAQLEDDISTNTTVVDRLQNSRSVADLRSDALTKELGNRTGGKSYFTSSEVRSVYRQWGFVTLAGGDNIGVVKKSKLSVQRGGEEIAQLIVTGVEANSAAANIIPSSVIADVTVSPGDTVVPLAEEVVAPAAQ